MNSEYNPNRLLNLLLDRMMLKNDAALCRALGIAAPLISKIRNHHLPVGASMLIRMHDLTGLSIAELRESMGDRRKHFRLSTKGNGGVQVQQRAA